MIYKLVTRIIQYFCFPNRLMKGGDILDFQKGGNLRKGGVDLEKGGMTPPYQLCISNGLNISFTIKSKIYSLCAQENTFFCFLLVIDVLISLLLYILFQNNCGGSVKRDIRKKRHNIKQNHFMTIRNFLMSYEAHKTLGTIYCVLVFT